MQNILENDDTSLSQPIDRVSLPRLVGAVFQIVTVTLLATLFLSLFSGEQS